MVSTYTANLAAFLTSKQMESDIKDVEALASQSAIKYGCGYPGSTCAFFQVRISTPTGLSYFHHRNILRTYFSVFFVVEFQ